MRRATFNPSKNGGEYDRNESEKCRESCQFGKGVKSSGALISFVAIEVSESYFQTVAVSRPRILQP